MTNGGVFDNGCRHPQTEVSIREDMWVCPVLIHGGENSQRRAGWFHFIALESSFKVISAFATIDKWAAAARGLTWERKRCRGFSGSEVMSVLAQDKSGNKTAINYKVRLRGNSNKCTRV